MSRKEKCSLVVSAQLRNYNGSGCVICRAGTVFRFGKLEFIVAMIGQYSYGWQGLRNIRRRFLFAVVAGVLIFLLVPPSNYLPGRVGIVLRYTLFAGWIAVALTLFASYIQYSYWDCPRCRKPYHMKSGFLWRWINPFARRCLHCGLPKWDEGP